MEATLHPIDGLQKTAVIAAAKMGEELDESLVCYVPSFTDMPCNS